MPEASSALRSRMLLIGALVLGSGAHGELGRFTVGNDERPWAEWGSMVAADVDSEPGWLQPVRADSSVNLLNDLYARGRLRGTASLSVFDEPGDGRIWTHHLPFGQRSELVILADGEEDGVSFDRFNRDRSNIGVSFYLDLGIAYPLTTVIFRPLLFGHHVDLFIKGYELLTRDDSDEIWERCGDPGGSSGSYWNPNQASCGFEILAKVGSNSEPEVRNSDFEPEYTRFLQIRVTTPQPFEIDQIDLRGDGFVQRAVYTSRVIELPAPANFNRLFWSGEADPGTRAVIQTRFGSDPTTRIYNEINDVGAEVPLEKGSDEDNKTAWGRLQGPSQGSSGDDIENWTLWSAPYEAPGQRAATTGPKQFFQFRAILETSVRSSRARLDSIAFEFSSPTQARQVAGQITPREGIELGVDTTFTYRLASDIGEDDVGFDAIELDTPTDVRLLGVRLGDRLLTRGEEYESRTGEALQVLLLGEENRVASSLDTLELTFDASILVYGTVFGGRVWSSWDPDLLPQDIEEESVGDLTVLGSDQSLGRILTNLSIQPRLLTPNGDDVNDRTRIAFQVSQVIGAAVLEVEIRDLSGRLVAGVLSEEVESGDFELSWDGRDREGRLLPPGLYLCRIRLDGDAGELARMATVGIAY